MAADEGHHRRSSQQQHHFLVVTYGAQSHINPARALAHRLARLGGVNGSAVLATLSVPASAYRRMFPSASVEDDAAAESSEATDGAISIIPHSDGSGDKAPLMRRAVLESLSTIVARLAARGQPVTCVVCTTVIPSVLDFAREHSIPAAIYWIQPATLLAICFHYFHGYKELIASHAMDPAYEVCLPGLSRPLQIGNFPTSLVHMSGTNKFSMEMLRELFEYMDHQWRRPKVLVNTFDELEKNALAEMRQHMDVFAIGPMVVGSPTEAQIHLFKHDNVDKKRYMEWLHSQKEKSVVYVSFGSVIKFTKQQMDEIAGGLRQCGRPYLLVVRRDDAGLKDDDDDGSHCLEKTQTQGMVVDWCNQLEVLSHPAVGCFVSHGGWNSTIEALVSGVPIIGVPDMFDQPTNVHMVENEWQVGIKGERNSDGVLTGAELARCIELVMGASPKATAMRERAKALKEIAQEAASTGGHAERNLRDFVRTIQASRGPSMARIEVLDRSGPPKSEGPQISKSVNP